MKTAEEWFKEDMDDPTPYSPQELDAAWKERIKQIRLDAYRAGK